MRATPAKLLIVDDDPLLLGLLSAIFRQVGLSVRTMENGIEALEAMREEMPDILLADVNMPGMSGVELLSVVRRRLPGLHVIAMSGTISSAGMELGVAADHFYEKDAELGMLLRMVESASGKRRPESAQARGRSPLWVSKVGHDVEGAYAMIACPDCLRTFAQSLDETRVRLVHQTACEHCRKPIEYAMVGAGWELERKPGAGVGAPGAATAVSA